MRYTAPSRGLTTWPAAATGWPFHSLAASCHEGVPPATRSMSTLLGDIGKIGERLLQVYEEACEIRQEKYLSRMKPVPRL